MLKCKLTIVIQSTLEISSNGKNSFISLNIALYLMKILEHTETE